MEWTGGATGDTGAGTRRSRNASWVQAQTTLRVAFTLLGVAGYLLVLVVIWEAQRDTREEAHENRARIVALEETIVRMDAAGSTALRRHEETPVGRAHPETSSIACPTCPPCR